ncbi:MAG: MFS transporter [Clostridia bacterium]|nr:MFS transporter [Clostridia bacterium]
MVSILVVIYIVFISLGLPDSLFGVAWPVVHNDFMIPESFASFYSIVTGVCSGGVSFVAGYVIRKFGTPLVTLFSTFLTVIGLVGISFSPNIWVMMLFTVVMSYGAGAIDTALNNFISLHYEARHMSWLHCFWGVGVTISPLIMAQFLGGGTGGWRYGYRAVAVLQAIVAVIVLLSLKKWRGIDVKIDHSEKTENKNTEKVNIFKIKGVITSILSQGFYCSMEFLIGTWGATYLVNVYGTAPDIAARWVSVYFGGIMLGRLVSGFVSLKASDNTLIRGGISISFLGMVLLLLPLGEISIIGLLLIGFGFGPVFPSILHSVPARFGEEYSADLTGFHMGGAYAIGFLVQLVFGYTASATTFKITPVVLVVFCALLFAMNEITIKKVVKGK